MNVVCCSCDWGFKGLNVSLYFVLCVLCNCDSLRELYILNTCIKMCRYLSDFLGEPKVGKCKDYKH